MAEPGGGEIVVDPASPPTTPKRSSTRVVKPTSKVQNALQSFENATVRTTKKPAISASRLSSAVTETEQTDQSKKGRSNGDTGKAMLQKVLELLGQVNDEVKELKGKVSDQSDTIRELRRQIHESHMKTKGAQEELQNAREEFRTTTEELRTTKEELKSTKEELRATKGELRQVRDQLEVVNNAVISIQSSPQTSYADVARTPPLSQPSNVRTLSSMHTTPSSFSDTFQCTIDTTRVEEENRDKTGVGEIRQTIESEMRAKEGHETWRCAAVVKDARNTGRVKIICRDEAELQLVKEAAQKTVIPGARVMRDQLYPIKVDNANRTAVLDGEGNVLTGAAEALGAENNVSIAKISWLSNRDSGKAYGSMVIYVTKGSDAKRLLEGRYFDLAGESAYTNVFEPRVGPIQCFNCQEIGHKAFSCKKAQSCGRCAQQGHGHRQCQAVEPKCVLCGGPHDSLSLNCRVRKLCNDA